MGVRLDSRRMFGLGILVQLFSFGNYTALSISKIEQ
jgi:hypothetical protein